MDSEDETLQRRRIIQEEDSENSEEINEDDNNNDKGEQGNDEENDDEENDEENDDTTEDVQTLAATNLPHPIGVVPQVLAASSFGFHDIDPVSYTHLRAHETPEHLVCRLLLEK